MSPRPEKTQTALRTIAGALAALALAAPFEAGATVLFGNYDPSNTAVTEKEHFLPLNYRAPDASQTFTTAADNSGFCGDAWCSYIATTSVTTEFVAPTDFLASRLIVPVSMISPYGNRRVGFAISHYDDALGAWTGLGYMQVESGLVPANSIQEVDAPFGDAGGRFVDFAYKPIQFNAGDRYMISASGWAGAAGYMSWYLSDELAASGQSIQHFSHGKPAQNLAYQPAFAFTDGGALTSPVSGVPEPGTWAMMILGVGLAGAALRRRRVAVAA